MNNILTDEDFQDAIMKIELEAINNGVSVDEIISLYELRIMALQEENET